jgi:hypothetical protein
MDVPRGGRGRLAPRGRRRLAVRQSMVRIAAAATPPTPTSSTTVRADHGAARGDYRRYRHPVASRLRCRSRIVGLAAFRVKEGSPTAKRFIDAVGLGFEYGGFPGLLLRLFLHRVTG